MKNKISFSKTAFLVSALLVSFSTASMAAGEEEKLKELERAMGTPTNSGVPVSGKKPRTRAIVFDADPVAAAPVASAPASQVALQAPQDCHSLPADASMTAVDFAIQFKVASAEVAPSSEGILMQISKILSLSPNRCVLVEGHTDISGNAAKNMALSQDRAISVVKFITSKAAMDVNRFVPLGKGSSDLLKNVDPRSPLNRRVVFKVVG